MVKIKNIEGLTFYDINRELNNGAKFVIFIYCYSIIIMTFKRSSDIYFIRAGESTLKYSIRYIIITLLFGWWGVPWGLIWSISSLYINLKGGKDVTQEVIDAINSINK